MAVILVTFCKVCKRVTAHRLVYLDSVVVGARCLNCSNVIEHTK